MLSEATIAIENIIRGDLYNSQNTRHLYLRAAFTYCSRFGVLKKMALIEEFRGLVAKWSLTHEINLTKREICGLADLLPTTPDEAKTLIESLTRVSDEVLKE